jgi:Fe-S-cluster-containing dehydrogenase component
MKMAKKLAMVIDNDLCWGCNTCELACKQENSPPEGSRWIRVRTKGVQKIDGRLRLIYSPARCLHCSKPSCKEVCPVDAIFKRPDGIVLVNPETCTGCKACIEACPFGVMQFNSEKGVAEKCHLCYHRIDRGERPACVDKCIGRCIHFGEIEELLSRMGDKHWKIAYDSEIIFNKEERLNDVKR